MIIIGILYLLCAVFLALYGFNTFVLIYLYLRHRNETLPLPPLDEWPPVTVQLPIFNEVYVVGRLIDAVAHLTYPRERLQIQVLDDSTDETTTLARRKVQGYRSQGIDIELVHRHERVDFKAGALREGLKSAKGRFIVLFDADFVPPSDFLLNTIPYFGARPRLGFIQTRWGHINGSYSSLTQAQAIALDGHFVVEQTARQRSGLFMNFNGTAGVWRRRCIEEAGGWQGDTLSEDMDLSYRAQLKGWECLYLPHVVAPAEIPPQIHAFKRQQYRWAKGSIQCALKLGPTLLTGSVPLFKRLQGLIHLTNYLVHPLMTLLLLLSLPLLLLGRPFNLHLTFISLASLGPPALYLIAQRALYPDWRRRFARFPFLVLVGTGIALNNTKAIWEAVIGKGSDFGRTPKFRVEERGDRWKGKRYALPLNGVTVGEALLALYALAAVVVAAQRGSYYAVPFLLLYGLGFGYVAFLTILHSRPRIKERKRRKKPAFKAPSVPKVLSE